MDEVGIRGCKLRRRPASNGRSEIKRCHGDMQNGQDTEHGNCVDAVESADKPRGWTQVVPVRQAPEHRHVKVTDSYDVNDYTKLAPNGMLQIFRLRHARTQYKCAGLVSF